MDKQEMIMKHLNAYRSAINEIDDFFEYANESESDRKKVREVLHRLTEKLMMSSGDMTKPTASEE